LRFVFNSHTMFPIFSISQPASLASPVAFVEGAEVLDPSADGADICDRPEGFVGSSAPLVVSLRYILFVG